MSPITALLSLLIGLAANGVTTVAQKRLKKEFDAALGNKESLHKALHFGDSVDDEVRRSCVQLARDRAHAKLPMSLQEQKVWGLLSDESFQNDVVEWLKVGGIEEGDAVNQRLIRSMEVLLEGSEPKQIEFLRTKYFNAVETAIYANPVLAGWRHQLSLDYLAQASFNLEEACR